VGQDKIDLSTIDANTLLAGDQAFAFVTNFTTTAGQVRYSGGIVYINTDTDTAAEFEIALTGVVPASLAATDFLL
jgi:serralysin